MKISDIETFLVNIGGQNRVLLRVLADEHLHGTGEAYCVGPDEATVRTIHYFKDWLVGQDPFRIEHLGRLPYNGSRYPGGSVVLVAISGIEQALWGLKGKAFKVPVYELAGTAAATRCASTGASRHPTTPGGRSSRGTRPSRRGRNPPAATPCRGARCWPGRPARWRPCARRSAVLRRRRLTFGPQRHAEIHQQRPVQCGTCLPGGPARSAA
jgi:L-alanine-DL-glutamate epimerase-like enolase superfamily enzyme